METNDIERIFASNLKYLREQANLKQKEIANQLNVTDQAVSKWELGKSVPELTTLVKIAKFYGISTDDLTSVDLRKQHEHLDGEENELINNNQGQHLSFSGLTFNKKIKSTKEGKNFFISLIVSICSICLSIPFAFFPLDIWSIIILIVFYVLNAIALVWYIKALIDLNHNHIRGNFNKMMKVVAPINLAIGLFYVVIYISILSEYHITQPIYIVLMIYYLVEGLMSCLENYFYTKAKENE